MTDIHNSHEQDERVKSWLRENGSAIVMGLVLAFGLMFGLKQWPSRAPGRSLTNMQMNVTAGTFTQ